MRWLAIIAVMALLGYFETDRSVIFFVCVMLTLGSVGYDIDNLEKSSPQSKITVSRVGKLTAGNLMP